MELRCRCLFLLIIAVSSSLLVASANLNHPLRPSLRRLRKGDRQNLIHESKLQHTPVCKNRNMRRGHDLSSVHRSVLSLRGGSDGSPSLFQLFMRIFVPGFGEKKSSEDDTKASLDILKPGILKRVKRFALAIIGIRDDSGRKGDKVKKGDGGKTTVALHLDTKHRPGNVNYRIQKELKEFIENPPDGCQVSVGKSLRVWIVTITGAKGTLFEGEKFRLRVAFPDDYPTRAPSVYFLQSPPPPKHEHVYTNGDICLSLLGKDWKPNLTASSLALSILSMLSSATEKRTPQDNAAHANAKPGQRQDNWVYHDNFA